MTDKEFKRLNRAQLIDVIYQLQLQVDKLTKQNESLEAALEDKRLRISNAGSLAEAALEINDCFRNAQKAAEHYLNEIKLIHTTVENDRKRILADAQAEAAQLVSTAQAEAEKLVSDARAEAAVITETAEKAKLEHDAAVETILKEYGLSYLFSGDKV